MSTEKYVAHEVVMPGLEMQEHELAAPARGEAIVKMEATGVSFAEVQMLNGRYPGQPAFPFVPGYDLVGRVDAVGAGVDPALRGKRVATMTQYGAWADYVRVPAEELVVVPDNLDAAEIDALIVNGVTAYKMLHRTARVEKGQTIVVLGAGGGVGTMLVQLAKIANVTVIGTCKPAQREAVESLGAKVVDYTRGQVADDVRALAPSGVDAVFDHVGGEGLWASWEMLREGGILVNYGNAAIAKESGGSNFTAFLEFLGKKTLWGLPFRGARGRHMTFFDVWGRGSFGADKMFRPARFWREFREDLEALVKLLAAKALAPQVAQRLPLRDAGKAIEKHRKGGFTGKIVLEA